VLNNIKPTAMRLELLLILSCIIISCESKNTENNPDCFQPNLTDTVFIGYEPINIDKINSAYDDYNTSITETIIENNLLIFSSNRNSLGNNFDIISYNLGLIFSYLIDTTTYQYYVGKDSLFCNVLPEINTTYNEYGPNLQLINFTPFISYPVYDSLMMFITRDENGDQDILCKKYSHKKYYSDYIPLENKFRNLSILNSEFDDAYASISFDFKSLYFCSNRTGDFDIYRVNSSNNANIYNVLYNDSAYQIEKVSSLNSAKDDKCPYIKFETMIFASNRDGGYGGYDLYYSFWIDNKWSEPKNFGEKINTEYDEFRPISLADNSSVIIFSSNRPCGKGGFDLYIVRITDIHE
jgi:hypothetical protein